MNIKLTNQYLHSLKFKGNPYLPHISSCSDIIQGKSEAIQSTQLGLLELKSKVCGQFGGCFSLFNIEQLTT